MKIIRRTTWMLLLLFCMYSFCACTGFGIREDNIKDLIKKCELSTLSCQIHICTEMVKTESTKFLGIFSNDKDYTYLVQFDGIYEIGVDFIGASFDQTSGTVTVTLTEPHLLKCNVIENSLSEYPMIVYENGIYQEYRHLSVEEIHSLSNDTLENMRQEIESKRLNYDAANENAKALIRAYFDKIGKELGAEYTVKFVYEKPDISIVAEE